MPASPIGSNPASRRPTPSGSRRAFPKTSHPNDAHLTEGRARAGAGGEWSPGPTAAGSERVVASLHAAFDSCLSESPPHSTRDCFTGDSQLSRRMRRSSDSPQNRRPFHTGGGSSRRRNERLHHERQEPEIDHAGRTGPRPSDARTEAPLAPLRDGSDDGRRVRRRALGPLRRLQPRGSRWTAADVYAAAVHRGNSESLA